MATTFAETILLTFGLSGYYITIIQAIQASHYETDERVSLAAQMRRTAAKSKALKEKYGSFALLSVFLISTAMCIPVCLSPLIAVAVFPANNFWGIFCALGILFWIQRATYWLTRRFL